MAKIPSTVSKGGVPSLKPEDLDGADAAIGTVVEADVRDSRFGQAKLVLRFEEWKDRELWLGKTEARIIVGRYGDDTDGLVGKKVPLVALRKQVGGRTYHTVDIAPDEEWDAMLSRGKSSKAKK